MTTHHQSSPIVLCGRLESIGSVVIEHLKPEYEVIHFITSTDEGALNLPLILSGSRPKLIRSYLGSRDIARLPKAVVVGGGYDDQAIAQLRQAVAMTEGTIKVPWLKADHKKTEQGPVPGTEDYAISVALRVKEALGTLKATKRLDDPEDGIFLW